MATNTQILLPLMLVVLAEGHYIDSYEVDIDEPDHKPSFWPKGPSDYHERYSYSRPGASMRRPTNYRPRNDDIYNYYSKGVYDSFRPYINYLKLLGNQNFDNVHRGTNGWPNSYNKFDYSGQENSHEREGFPAQKFDEYSDENQEPEISPLPLSLDPGSQKDNFKSLTDDQNYQNLTLKRNEEKYTNNAKDVSSKVNVDAEKDINTVDSNKNNAYLVHQNDNQPVGHDAVHTPVTFNSNKSQQFENQSYQTGNGQPPGSTVYVSIVANIPGSAVPISNQPTPGNVVYVPVLANNNNQQQPVNPVYQLVNGQPPSIPLTANRLNSINNDLASINHVGSSPPANNYSPIYIYANGQLILIPGYAVNPPPNIGYQELAAPGNYLYTNPPAQIKPALLDATTVTPLSNDDLKTSPVLHNLLDVENPSSTNNLKDYDTPDANNYLNISPKEKDHVPIDNSLDQHPVGKISNPSTPSSNSWEIDNNMIINKQPTSTKDRVDDEEEY